MAIGEKDITALTEDLSVMLSAMREYQQLTVELLNSEIEEAHTFLDARQLLINDITETERRMHTTLVCAVDEGEDDNLGRMLNRLTAASSDSRFDGVIALAKQLLETFRDVSVIDAKLLAGVEKKRNEMMDELKSVSGRRRVADAPYFSAKGQLLGAAYDRKK